MSYISVAKLEIRYLLWLDGVELDLGEHANIDAARAAALPMLKKAPYTEAWIFCVKVERTALRRMPAIKSPFIKA